MNKREWKPKTKAEIVLEGLTLSSDDAIAKLCQIHGISVKQYRQWEKDFINNAERVFAPPWHPKNQLSPQEIIMVWQHFANIGGHDKDRMVNIMMFLSPLLFATIGYAYTKPDKVAAMIGLLTSLIAVVVVLMYSGYADRNWSHADRIAETYLDETYFDNVNPLSRELKPEKFYHCGLFGRCVHKLARFLSRPHDPQKSLAPIFQLFLILSVITALVSLALWVGWLP